MAHKIYSEDSIRKYFTFHKAHLDSIFFYNKNNEAPEAIPQLSSDVTESFAHFLIKHKGILKDIYKEKIITVERKGRSRKKNGGGVDIIINKGLLHGDFNVEVKASYNNGNFSIRKLKIDDNVLIWLDGSPFFKENKTYIKVCVFPNPSIIKLYYVESDNSNKTHLKNDRKKWTRTKFCKEYLVDMNTFKVENANETKFFS